MITTTRLVRNLGHETTGNTSNQFKNVMHTFVKSSGSLFVFFSFAFERRLELFGDVVSRGVWRDAEYPELFDMELP